MISFSVRVRSSWPRRVALGLSLLSLGLISAGGCTRKEGAKHTTPRVLLIGIDGADLQIIDRLIGEGKLPTFQRLEREGAFGLLKSQEPLLSPLVWTTIATGRKAQDHGVLDFVEVGADGQATPITSLRRRVPALWNIGSEYGKKVGFVGWYASYPAEPVRGFEVSDRLAFHQVRSARATSSATYPEKLSEEIRSRFGEPVPDLAATKNRFIDDPGVPLTPDGGRRLVELSKIYATSEFYRRILPPLESEFRPDLLAVYFEGIDACGHLFMEDAPPKRAEISGTDFAAFSKTVDRYYEYQDEVLADILRLEGPDTVTLIVSDHGFKSGETRPRTSGRADIGLAPLWHRLYGVVFLHGAGIRPSRIAPATVLDVTPTVLSLLSLPLSRELSGHPIAGAFSSGPKASESKTVERYPPLPQRAKPAAAPADTEAVQKLMALGYLGGATKTAAHDSSGRTASSYLNEGIARSKSGDQDGALRALGQAAQLDPKIVHAQTNAAAIYIRRRDYTRAKELLDHALTIDPNDFWLRAQRAVWELDNDHLEAAAAEIAAAERIDDRLPVVVLLRARLEHASGNLDKALDRLRRAEELTDVDELRGQILLLRARIESDQGRLVQAEKALRAAERLVPSEELDAAWGNLSLLRHDAAAAERFFRQALRVGRETSALHRGLGEALAAMKRYADAEVAFRAALATAATEGEREAAYVDLAICFQQQERETECRGILREATDRIAGSATLWALLGAAYGRAGDYPSAIEAYERSIAIRPTSLDCKTLAALVFEVRKDRPRAIALWQQSLALDPNQPDVRGFLQRYRFR